MDDETGAGELNAYVFENHLGGANFDDFPIPGFDKLKHSVVLPGYELSKEKGRYEERDDVVTVVLGDGTHHTYETDSGLASDLEAHLDGVTDLEDSVKHTFCQVIGPVIGHEAAEGVRGEFGLEDGESAQVGNAHRRSLDPGERIDNPEELLSGGSDSEEGETGLEYGALVG